MHCNTLAIVTKDWNLRQEGFCQKWLQNKIWDALPWHTQLQCSLVDLAEAQEGSWSIPAEEGQYTEKASYICVQADLLMYGSLQNLLMWGKAAKMRWFCLL